MFELYDFKTCEFRFNGFQKFRENEKKRLNNRRDLIFRLLRTKWRIYSVIWARKWKHVRDFDSGFDLVGRCDSGSEKRLNFSSFKCFQKFRQKRKVTSE